MKKLRNLSLIILIGILLFGNAGLNVQATEEFEIEQVQANMPEVTAYVRSQSEMVSSDLEAWLGEEKLTVDSIKRFAETGQATDYFVLVDVSNSMPDDYCTNVKATLKNFSESLAPNDKMVLMAFGEEVTVLLFGEETSDVRAQAIDQLHNTDRKTLLFEAIQKTADMADKMQDDARKIVLVISDGENFAAGKSTSEEAKTSLGDRNMPVYAMGISDTSRENLNQFGEIARTLGGTLSVFTAEETEATLTALQEEWENTWVIDFSASSNKVNNSKNTFLLKQLSTGISRNREVMVSKYQSDSGIPQIVSVEKTGDKQLTVIFDEAINGAENSAAWKIEFGEKLLPVVTTVVKDSTKVELNFEDELYGGYYNISAPGVYDSSMEQNKATTKHTVKLEGPEQEVEEKIPGWQEMLQTWWWVILVFAFVVVLIVILIIWRKIKRSRGIVYVNGKASLVDNVSERQHISIEKAGGFPVSIELLGLANGKNKIQTKIHGSMIVGRADICDLSLDDPKMSRQHFALEYDGNGLFITDLETTNGTKVNNKLIKKDYRLQAGDIISVGDIRLKIDW